MTHRLRTRVLPCLLLAAALLAPVLAQGTAPKASQLTPAARYVDAERDARDTRLGQLSTARLGPRVDYLLTLDDENEDMRVRIATEVQAAGDLCFVMPAWSPGSYRIVNNGRRVRDLTAVRDDHEYKLQRTNKDDPNLWLLKGVRKGPLVLEYSLPARAYRLRSAGRRHADSDPARRRRNSYQFDGPRVWIHEIRHKHLPCAIELRLPQDWDVATGLKPANGTLGGLAEPGRWHFRSPDYDVLVDCPTRMGFFESFGFSVDGTPFEISLFGAQRDPTDRQEFARRVKRISQHFARLFGGLPCDRYVYLFKVPGGGGLEHLNSTTIGLMSLKGSVPGKPVMWDFVIAHEFVHLWNVKRLRPRALGPFDYTGPNRTTALWLSEGVTSYYGSLGLVRIGLWSAKDYWRHMAGLYTRLRVNPARKRASVAESSWRVWDGRSPIGGRFIDYYLKGECLGLLLDIEIRHATRNRASLDNVMRQLYEQCRTTGVGFAEGDILKRVNEVAGHDLSEFFDRYVYGTDDLPLMEVLSNAGLKVERSGEGRRGKFTIREAEDASSSATAIRKGLVGKWPEGGR